MATTNKAKADKLCRKIENMRREWRSWKGTEPKTIRLRMSDYLLATETGVCDKDGRYKLNNDITIAAG